MRNENRLKPWNITQLAIEMRKDLELCQSAFERFNCQGIYRKEMRELKDEIKELGRKLTPGEESVLIDMGIDF